MVYPKYFTHQYARSQKKTLMQEPNQKHVVSNLKQNMEILEDCKRVKIIGILGLRVFLLKLADMCNQHTPFLIHIG
jgi:hypothetical protein